MAHAIWRTSARIVHRKGLVLGKVHAGDSVFLHGVRAPYLAVKFRSHREQIIEYCDGDEVEPFKISHGATGTRLDWGYKKKLFIETGITGTFIVRYMYRLGAREPGCAGRNIKPGTRFTFFTRRCFRFVPVVEYRWEPAPENTTNLEIEYVEINFRFDYGQVGTGFVSDGNWVPTAMATSGFVPIETRETVIDAVKRGMPGTYDNIHTAHPTDGHRTIIVPGCRSFAYDCVHMHWRWGGTEKLLTADPLIEPLTGKRIVGARPGGLHLTPGQSVWIGVIADNGEGDVYQPLRLANQEKIATADTCKAMQRNRYVYLDKVLRKNIVIWYVAQSYGPVGRFMRHGFFALERLRTIKEQKLSVAYLADQGLEFRRTLCDPKSKVTASTLSKG